MCIIAVKPNYQPFPSTEQIKILWDDNKDGAGYAWYDATLDQWQCKKAFMKWEDFIDELQNDRRVFGLDTKTVLIHCRIATSGPRDGSDTHPFPISHDEVDGNRDVKKFTVTSMLMHNGVYATGTDEESDTQAFVSDVLWPMYPALLDSNPKAAQMWSLVDEFMDTNSNRWVVTMGGTVHLYGKWIHDTETGCYFSNERFVEEDTYYYYTSSTKTTNTNNVYNYQGNDHLWNQNYNTYPSQLDATMKSIGYSLVDSMLPFKADFLQGDKWNWDNWDRRYDIAKARREETKKTPEIDPKAAVYDEDGKILWYLRDDDIEEVTDSNDTFTCLKCSMTLTVQDLNEGECPTCGMKVVEDREVEQEEHLCPYCATLTLPYQSADPVKTTGLTDISFCTSCNIVFGYVMEGGSIGEHWILGWLDKDSNLVYVNEQEKGYGND